MYKSSLISIPLIIKGLLPLFAIIATSGCIDPWDIKPIPDKPWHFVKGDPEFGACLYHPGGPFSQVISDAPLHPKSADYINTIGKTKSFHPDMGGGSNNYGIPYIKVGTNTSLTQVNSLKNWDGCKSEKMPVPLSAPIEVGNDKHVLVIQAIDSYHCDLYELWHATPQTSHWEADCASIFKDIRHFKPGCEGCTSADAAGLPILPYLVRYPEISNQKHIGHALRFTAVPSSKIQKGFIHPATHSAGKQDYNPASGYLPMGLVLRLKDNDHTRSICSGGSQSEVICDALRTYGMIHADASDKLFSITGGVSNGWNDNDLSALKNLTADDFEAVDTGKIIPMP